MKFKDHKNFEPEKDGVLTQEFFKFFGNLFEADHAKLCRHILNRSGPSRKLPHPKVVVKQPTTVVEDCYSVKEWIECRKKKAMTRFQLHLIRPELGLYTDNNKQFVQIAWKNFKKEFSVSKASMRVLLNWGPTDLYYTNQRQTQHRNTPCEDLSPYESVPHRLLPTMRTIHLAGWQVLLQRVQVKFVDVYLVHV